MTIKSNTPAHDKDCWQTPLWLFDALDIEFGFWLDSAASDKNALCAHWLTEADDALNSEWVLVMKKFSLTLTMMITLTGNLHRNG